MALPLVAIGLGANLLGGLIKSRGEAKRRSKIRSQRLAALKPLEASITQGQYGLSQGEGAIARQVTQQTVGDLAQRGILDSNIAAGQVAQAVAPVQLQHDDRNRQMAQYIAASKQAIASDTEAPGYGEAFGDALGDVGGYLALLEGRRNERQRRAQEHDYMLQSLGLLGQQQQGLMGPPAPAPAFDSGDPVGAQPASPGDDETADVYDRFRYGYPRRG